MMEATQGKQYLHDVKLFEGSTYQQMPRLIAAGCVPASAAQVMHSRLDGILRWDMYYDSGDAIIHHPDGRVKLVQDSEDLRRIHPGSPQRGISPVLPVDTWESVGGEVFSREAIAAYESGKRLKDHAKKDLFWRWLARGDHYLLSEYIDSMFSLVERCHQSDEAMGISICSLESPYASESVLRLWRLGGINYEGGAIGTISVCDNNGRLVGMSRVLQTL